MRNLVPALDLIALSFLLSVFGGGCAAQSPASPNLRGPDFNVRQFVLPTEFRIEADSADGYRFRILRTEDGSWSAVAEFGGQVWTATERGCPAFKDALEAFGRLPPLFPGPYELRDNPQPRALGPYRPHGRYWTFTMGALAPDYTVIDMRISGSQGPYPRWADDMVVVLKACGAETP